MRSELANQLVRSAVLLLLLTYFGYSLVHGLIEDERLKSPLMPGSQVHQDPGVRVLLENRPANDPQGHASAEPLPAWERLDITILQGVEVLDPSSPDDPARHLQLHSGSVLHLQPDTTTGLLLGSRSGARTTPGRSRSCGSCPCPPIRRRRCCPAASARPWASAIPACSRPATMARSSRSPAPATAARSRSSTTAPRTWRRSTCCRWRPMSMA